MFEMIERDVNYGMGANPIGLIVVGFAVGILLLSCTLLSIWRK